MLAFRSRGVMRSVWQEHIEGDLVKLYGIGEVLGSGSSGSTTKTRN